ncbi:hypothetical protein MTR_5g037347 [Medicago truncatula]|uniref:Uncharacterized protein n=1 Tax=Medicago truncatula TaxID=3880 RepID=A0A072UF92_MEDTR|nr:hypothetical protein MTR_5g037347 [Medicago truncatula]
MARVHFFTNVQPKVQASDSGDISIPSSQNKFNYFFTGSQASGSLVELHSGQSIKREGFFRIVAGPLSETTA